MCSAVSCRRSRSYMPSEYLQCHQWHGGRRGRPDAPRRERVRDAAHLLQCTRRAGAAAASSRERFEG